MDSATVCALKEPQTGISTRSGGKEAPENSSKSRPTLTKSFLFLHFQEAVSFQIGSFEV
jgi:hypothetical protein